MTLQVALMFNRIQPRFGKPIGQPDELLVVGVPSGKLPDTMLHWCVGEPSHKAYRWGAEAMYFIMWNACIMSCRLTIACHYPFWREKGTGWEWRDDLQTANGAAGRDIELFVRCRKTEHRIKDKTGSMIKNEDVSRMILSIELFLFW